MQLIGLIFFQAMLHSLNLCSKDFKFGITKVFFRPGTFVQFDRIMKSDPENLKMIVQNVKKWLVRSRWKKSVHCAICVIKSRLNFFHSKLIKCQYNFKFLFLVKNRMRYKNKCVVQAQKIIRGYLARKQHQPRVKGIAKINALKRNIKEMENVANQLKNDRETMLKQLKDIELQIDTAIKKIKVNFSFR